MNKKLLKHQVNFILLQLIAFTFVCIIAFVDDFISYDFIFVKIGIMTLTIISVVIYEIIVNYIYQKAKKNYELIEEDNKEINHNEKYLWFEILLLLDILIIVALISPVIKSHVNIAIPLLIGFILFYFISIIVKPYFGIKNKK